METVERDTMTESQRRTLFYYFGKARFDEDARRDFISDFTDGRTSSVKDLGYIEAQDMIRYMQELLRSPQERRRRDDLDRKRKGVLRAIGAYLELRGEHPSPDYVKGVAVRAAGMVPTMLAHDFNRIPEGTLTRIYNEFCRKQSVLRAK